MRLFFMVLLLPISFSVSAQSFKPDKETLTYRGLWHQGKYQEALNYLDNEIQQSPVPMDWLLDRAQMAFALGQLNRATAELEWLHQRRPTPETTLRLAKMYLYQGEKEMAQSILEELSERFRRATRYEDDTDNDLALQQVRLLLGGNPRQLFQTITSVYPKEKPTDHLKRWLVAGDLAFQKHDYQLASEYFYKALAIEPENRRAKVGIVQCLWKSEDPRLEEALREILELNPVDFTCVAIMVERLLDAKQTDDALENIEKMLAINPQSLRFLGLKSAALYLADREEQMVGAWQVAANISETPTLVYRTTARVASRHYRFEDALRFSKMALDMDPADHKTRALYAFDLLRLGKDSQGRKELDRSFRENRFNVPVYNMLALMDKLAQFKVISAPDFELKMPEKDMEIWGSDLLNFLRKGSSALEKRYHITPKRPVMIQVFDNHDDFMVRSVGLPGNEGHLGICFGQLVTMDSPAARPKHGMNWQAVLYHEYVHVITLQKTKNRMARWLSEGVSVYEERKYDPSWGQRLDPRHRSIRDSEGLPTLESLDAYFSRPKTSEHLMYGYFVAGEFISFYVETYGFHRLLESMDLIRSGIETNQALLQAATVKAPQLNDQFQKFMTRRFEKLDNVPAPVLYGNPLGTMGKSEDTVSPFTDAIARGDRAASEENWTKAEKSYQEAFALFPEYQGKDGPVQRLIQIYEKLGNEEKQAEMHQKSLSLDPRDYAACSFLAKRFLDQEQWPKLEEIARRGLAIDPFDIPMRQLLAKSLFARAQKSAFQELDRLLILDPNHKVDYLLDRIDLLIQTKAKAKAKKEVLSLLEEVPFSWEAQKRLLDIKEQF